MLTASFGCGVAMGWSLWLLLLLLLRERMLQARPLPGVMLPVQDLLFVYELGTLRIHQLLSEMLILQ